MALKATKTPTKKKPAAKKKAAPTSEETVEETVEATPVDTMARDSDSGGAGEISCFNAAISAMDEAANCLGGIPYRRRDSELMRVINEYTNARPAIMERLDRVIARKG